jgi:hypothetical protein
MECPATYTATREALRALGIALNRQDGEYRVAPVGTRRRIGTEAEFYYTDDLQDAFDTGLAMAANPNDALMRGHPFFQLD